MNDIIHPLKQLCKVIRWAPRNTPTSLSSTLFLHRQTIPHPTSSYLSLIESKSPALSFPGTFSEEGDEQSPHRLFIALVIFLWLICNRRRKCPIAWSLATEMVGFPSHLWLTWILTALWTWPKARARIGGADFCELTGRGGPHIPDWGDGFSCAAVSPIYIQDPPPLRYPVEWLTPGYTCASENIG